jgi:hypothetical protein
MGSATSAEAAEDDGPAVNPARVTQDTNLGAGLPDMAPGWDYQWFISVLYAVGIILWIIVWLSALGMTMVKSAPILWVGLAAGIFIMGLNFWTCHSERVTTYGEESSEKETVIVHAFYTTTGLFAFAGLLGSLHGEKMRGHIKKVAYLFLLALLVNIAFLFPPIWVSTEQSMPVIIMKHIYTIVFAISSGFVVSALCYLLHALRKINLEDTRTENMNKQRSAAQREKIGSSRFVSHVVNKM